MSVKNFIITQLKIYKKCHERYRKVLKSETFQFNLLDLESQHNSYPIEANIFGKRVFIQTVVGMNGSGKSSLMELIYRIINNYSYYILKNSEPFRIAAEPVFLIEKIYADLDFIIDGEKCSIMVRDKSLGVIIGEQKVFFGESKEDFRGFNNLDGANKDDIVKLASSSFYTIVTNYSFQSMVSRDFAKDIAEEFVGSKASFGQSSEGNWLDSLFRKNDGYITPIVLNPYREAGKIDLNREYDLTISRISALLIESKKRERELLKGYSLADIHYRLNNEHFIGKLFPENKRDEGPNLFGKLMDEFDNSKSLCRHIVRAYGLRMPGQRDENNIFSYAYLVYKTLSVLEKYDHYQEFKDIPKVTEFRTEISDQTRKSLTKAIAMILEHSSHATIKIFQTLNFIRSNTTQPKEFKLSSYRPYMALKNFGDIHEILKHLPPPFYIQEIRLYKGENKQKEILLSGLSSGERQFIYTISTIVYHVKNLLSVQQTNRIRYRNINIVLDEVEICFHPEYQRQFIFWLLDLIERLNLTRACSFNIMIVTHSPFILSDIPKKNILYLKDGRQHDDAQLVNPYSANINDILYQSFFLEGGFMGEHAKNTINSAFLAMERITKKLPVSKKSLWNERTLRELIGVIGEPLLRDSLLELHSDAFEQNSFSKLIKQKDDEIQQLKDQINRISDQRP